MGAAIRLEFKCSKCKMDNILHSGCIPRINEDRMDWVPFEVEDRFTFKCTECEFPTLFQGTKEWGFTPVLVSPCSMCTGTMDSKWEINASDWVCAGCYNEFAVKKGWEAA
jgi:hypothetical protein